MSEGSTPIDDYIRPLLERNMSADYYMEHYCSVHDPRLRRLLKRVLRRIVREDQEYRQWLFLSCVVEVCGATALPVWTSPDELDYIPKNFVVLTRFLEELSDKAAIGVIAHEFGHVKTYTGPGLIKGLRQFVVPVGTLESDERKAQIAACEWGFAEELIQAEIETNALGEKLRTKAHRRRRPFMVEELPYILEFKKGREEIRIVLKQNTATIAELQGQGFTFWKRFGERAFLKRPATDRSTGNRDKPMDDAKE